MDFKITLSTTLKNCVWKFPENCTSEDVIKQMKSCNLHLDINNTEVTAEPVGSFDADRKLLMDAVVDMGNYGIVGESTEFLTKYVDGFLKQRMLDKEAEQSKKSD